MARYPDKLFNKLHYNGEDALIFLKVRYPSFHDICQKNLSLFKPIAIEVANAILLEDEIEAQKTELHLVNTLIRQRLSLLKNIKHRSVV